MKPTSSFMTIQSTVCRDRGMSLLPIGPHLTGSDHEKGEMLGNFLFGGSDFVMLFQKHAGFELTATPDIHILMGKKYGVMKGTAE
jgi:hypothetical protein